MSDAAQSQHCPGCNNILPARGYFCGTCAAQARCKSCTEVLEPGAKACVMCGTPVGGGSPSAGAPVVGGSLMNTLELQEDTKSRSLRISFTDSAIANIGEAVSQLAFNRVMQRGVRPSSHQVQDDGYRQPNLLRAATEIVDGSGASDAAPAIPAPPAVAQGDAARIQEIFEAEGEEFRLEEHRLKADSRAEYARRLGYLYLYAHELAGRKPIPVAQVHGMLDANKVSDSNTRFDFAHKMSVEIQGDMVRLKKEGREKAIAILDEILNGDMTQAGWTPESQSPAAKSTDPKKPKSGGGKPGRKRSTVPEGWAAKWEKLQNKPDAHFALTDKNVLEKSICGLWAIHEVGGEVASFGFIQRFIASAFSLKEKERSIEKALTRTTAKLLVIKGEGGFKLTPSGTKRAKELLKVK